MASTSVIRRHHFVAGITVVFLLITISLAAKAKDERDCEVCIGVLKKIKESMSEDITIDIAEKAIKKYCKTIPGTMKEGRFCYFIGAIENAPTGILGKITKPLSYSKPVEKICQDLKTVDSQICELRFDVKPDFSNLNKLRVRDLKKILSNWNEDCKGCVEKSDFVKKVKELMPKYDPEEYKKLQEKTEL